MKRFLCNILTFSLLFVIVFALFHIFLIHSQKRILLLDQDVNKVFLGNSTFEYGIKDSLIPSSKNFGQNAETIDIVYAKLKLLKKFNPQLDTAYIELDDIILLNRSLPSVLTHPYYISSFTVEDIFNNIKNMTFERNVSYLYHTYDIVKIRPLVCSYFKESNISDLGIGGYADLYRNKLEEDLRNRIDVKNNLSTKIPEHNIYYYNALITFCHNNNITPIFLVNPMHKAAWTDTCYRNFRASTFPNIPMIDFLCMELPDSCFGDIAHLNYKGAHIYSDSLSRHINNK